MEALVAAGMTDGGEGVDHAFVPDVALEDGAVIEGCDWQLVARWTPGHIGNHLSLAWGDRVFTGDHVMGWATSIVSPPMATWHSSWPAAARCRGRGTPGSIRGMATRWMTPRRGWPS